MDGLLDSLLSVFFRDNIAYEPTCDGNGVCNADMKMFISFSLRWMTSTVQLCPWTQKRILPALRASARAAVAQCTGGANGRMCGMKWWPESTPSHITEFDGAMGLAQEMAALSTLMTVMLIEERTVEASAPVEVQPGSGQRSGSVSSVESGSGPGLGTNSESELGYTMASIPKPVTHNTGGTSQGDTKAGLQLESTLGAWKPPAERDIASAAIWTTLLFVGMVGMIAWICLH